MRVRGTPIERAALQHPGSFVSPPITGSATFHEWQAAHGAGLNLWDWEQGRYPETFKAKVVAWWRAHKAVELHSADASIKKPRKGR